MIKPKGIRDIQEFVASKAFTDWYARYQALHRRLQELRAHGDDLLVRTVLRAGEYEGLAAQAESEFAELDGSFEHLGEYEHQRAVASDVWMNLSRNEHLLAEARGTASELRALLHAAQKKTDSQAVQVERTRLETDLQAADKLVAEYARQVEESQQTLERETKRRDDLWTVVEDMWMTAFKANIARIEFDYLAKRTRNEVDTIARRRADGEAEESEFPEASVEEQTAEAEDHMVALLEEGATSFECAAISDFLYWPQEDDRRAALCVPLVGDKDNLNMQVDPLLVYRVDRNKGLKSLEPIPPQAGDDDDSVRLDDFFSGHPGSTATAPA